MLKYSLILIALVSAVGVAQAADKADINTETNKQATASAARPPAAKKGKADKRHSDDRKRVHSCDKTAKSARAADPVARKKMISDCRKA
jgi:hypothetical protein